MFLLNSLYYYRINLVLRVCIAHQRAFHSCILRVSLKHVQKNEVGVTGCWMIHYIFLAIHIFPQCALKQHHFSLHE